MSVITRRERKVARMNVAHVKIYEVNERPANLLGHAGYCIDDDLAHEDQNDVYEPCTCPCGFSGCIQISLATVCTLCIDPACIDVEVCATV